MEKKDIKTMAWCDVSKYNGLNNEEFNNCAISFKINPNYNLVVWCDVDYDCNVPVKYYIVSIRFNSEDSVFGNDIGIEYCTKNITKESLDEAIDILLNEKSIQLDTRDVI